MTARRPSRGSPREFQRRGRVHTGGSQDAAEAANREPGRVVRGPWPGPPGPDGTSYDVVRIGRLGTETTVGSYPATAPAAMTDAMTDAQQRADANTAVRFAVRKVTTETIWESEEP